MPGGIVQGLGRFVALAQQPTATRISHADGIETETVLVHKAGTHTPQHSHEYDHTTIVVSGALRVYADGVLKGEFRAVDHILIPAGVKHRFVSLEDNTVYSCIHNVSRKGVIEIREEHQIVEAI